MIPVIIIKYSKISLPAYRLYLVQKLKSLLSVRLLDMIRQRYE